MHLLPGAVALLLVAAGSATAESRAPRTGTIEVRVTYSAKGGWSRPPQKSDHVLDRTLVYRMPLIGHHSPASGWKELDAKLPPVIEGRIPRQNMSSGDIADLAASVEAAEAACGGDEDCMVARLMPKSKRLRDQGKLVIPARCPRAMRRISNASW